MSDLRNTTTTTTTSITTIEANVKEPHLYLEVVGSGVGVTGSSIRIACGLS